MVTDKHSETGWRSRRILRVAVFAYGVLVAGQAAFGAAGDLDPSFGDGGKVTTAIGASYASALVVQPDGKLVAAGRGSDSGNVGVALARYNSDGSLDSSFGSGGLVITNIGGANLETAAVVLQRDGKLVTAGNTDNGGPPSNTDFLLVRYNANGRLDTSFGKGGKVTTDIAGAYDRAAALVVQPDGKLVAAGLTERPSPSDTNTATFGIALVRYGTNGMLDRTFGQGGKVAIDFGSNESADGLVLQPDGKLVVVGTTIEGGAAVFALVRYNKDGTLDAGFGNGGRVTTLVGDGAAASALVIQPDGKLVAAGSLVQPASLTNGFALARYNGDGSLDGTFGSGGMVITPIFGDALGVAYALLLQSDGRLVAGGFAVPGLNDEFAVVRYNADGSLDSTFGTVGIVTTAFSSATYADALALAEQRDGKLVAAGANYSLPGFTVEDFALVRYLGAGPCLGDCNSDGVVTVSELVSGVDIALGEQPVSSCPAFANGSGMVDIAQLVAGVKNALNGCGGA